MELSTSNIKKCLIFSQKNAFLIFQGKKLFYISANERPELILYISGNGTFSDFRRNFQSPKDQNLLYVF